MKSRHISLHNHLNTLTSVSVYSPGFKRMIQKLKVSRNAKADVQFFIIESLSPALMNPLFDYRKSLLMGFFRDGK